MEGFIADLINDVQLKSYSQPSIYMTHEFIQNMLHSMDTEWDKKIVRFLLSETNTKSDTAALGIEHIDKDFILNSLNEIQVIHNEVDGIVNQKLDDRIDKISLQQITYNKQLKQKQCDWTSTQLSELQEEIEDLEQRKNDIKNLKNKTTKKDKIAFKRLLCRTSKNVIRKRRIGMRKTGGGRPLSMDDDDERFLVENIESKTTAHGRRHDTVMYTGSRVKNEIF